jgi:hypothetical protein
VTEPGRPALYLRRGEAGISVFETAAVDPPLMESEILDCFRAGSQVTGYVRETIEAKGLQIVPVLGAEP